MKKSVLGLSAIFIGMTFLLFSCGDSKYPGFEKTENGLYYKIHKSGDDTAFARIGDVLSIEMQYLTAKDSVFSESPEGEPFDVPMMESTYKGDIFEGLALLHKGDSATFILNADSFFLKTVGAPYLPPYIDSGSVIKLNIKVVNIQNEKQIAAKKAKEAKEMQAAEKVNIEKYITENNITQTPDANGVYFIEKTVGKGKAVENGKYAVIHFIGEILGGASFGNTYETKEPVNYLVGTARLGLGFDNCIMKMKKGGKATMIIPSAQAFGAEGNGYMIPPFATMKIEVEILDIATEEELNAKKEAEAKVKQQKEEGDLKKYVQKTYPKAKQLPTGVYYYEVKAGTGKQATTGSTAKVHYNGTLTDGNKFDSSYDRKTPFEFTIGRGDVIKGWDEGVAMMKEGGKAVIIIPSKLGYGSQGSGPIPPFSSLVFEVELISVSASPLK